VNWRALELGRVGNSIGTFTAAGGAADLYLTSNVYYNGIFRYANSSQTAGAYAVVGNSHAWYIAPSGTAGNAISFTQAMTLDASGNLGVGTTSPVGALQVLRASANPTVNVTRTTSSATTLGEALYLRLNDSNGQSGMRTEIGMGYGIPGTQTYTPAVIGYVQTIGTANTYGDLYFATRGVTTDTAPTERARITSGGDLLVGTTSATSRSGITAKTVSSAVSSQDAISAQTNSNSYFTVCSHVSTTSGTRYHIGFGDGTTWTERGTISTDGTSTSYNTSSDYRLKNITGPVTNSGAYIDALKPVEGTWKADGSTFVGLIAHEVQEVSRTNIATGTKDGERMQGMDYSASEIIANLIAEVKSLRARVAQLEAK
jgi:hypothetical protein